MPNPSIENQRVMRMGHRLNSNSNRGRRRDKCLVATAIIASMRCLSNHSMTYAIPNVHSQAKGGCDMAGTVHSFRSCASAGASGGVVVGLIGLRLTSPTEVGAGGGSLHTRMTRLLHVHMDNLRLRAMRIPTIRVCSIITPMLTFRMRNLRMSRAIVLWDATSVCVR